MNNFNQTSLKSSLNKNFLKQLVSKSQIEDFKSQLRHFLEKLDNSTKLKESEEHTKTIIRDFLCYNFKPEFEINTKGRQDMVIHSGKSVKTPVKVIIETKKTGNLAEIPSIKDSKVTNLNCKALQELVLYYLRERISLHNIELTNLIITDGYQWFIFDANQFEKYFGQNSQLIKNFKDFEARKLSGQKTDFFYKEIALPAIQKIQNEIEFSYFSISDYREFLEEQDQDLLPLYKFFLPTNLLKLSFGNDSNSLDKGFYNELLYIMGLEEIAGGKIIRITKNRQLGSLFENVWDKLDKPNFEITFELVITWINRILFLKLLEGQVVSWNQKNNSEFYFLSKIKNYAELNDLFFEVLAKMPQDRKDRFTNFATVPYLNSSLFEETQLEKNFLGINELRDGFEISIFGNTVLDKPQKDYLIGKSSLNYLLEFLNSYDFGAKNKTVQQKSKTIINTSVLGKFFEKLNGYKDGSFFTPSVITEFMAKESLEKLVLNKFAKEFGYNCQNLRELKDEIRENKTKREASKLVGKIKILEPSVGSGHILVSCLNQLILIKHKLGILQGEKGEFLSEITIFNWKKNYMT